MNKAERIKVANAEWYRLNEIDTEIRYLFDKLMYEMRKGEYQLNLNKCNELIKKITMLIKSKGD